MAVCASEMRQHRRIEQGLIARDGGGEAVRQRETRISFQMRKEIAMRETLTPSVRVSAHS